MSSKKAKITDALWEKTDFQNMDKREFLEFMSALYDEMYEGTEGDNQMILAAKNPDDDDVKTLTCASGGFMLSHIHTLVGALPNRIRRELLSKLTMAQMCIDTDIKPEKLEELLDGVSSPEKAQEVLTKLMKDTKKGRAGVGIVMDNTKDDDDDGFNFDVSGMSKH